MADNPAGAEESLHAKIDRLIEVSIDDPVAPPTTDAEFLRRIHLDLAGTIPTPDVARRFFADRRPDKRALLIDQLLDSPLYAHRMQNVFDVMLMERRPEKHIPAADWQQYLTRAFSANKPFNQLVREILVADGTDPEIHAAAKFFLDRNGESTLLTRDIGRLFFGMDLQCAQCHDHPVIEDYKQSDYYAINAFLHRSSVYEFQEKDFETKSGTVTFAPGITEHVIMITVRGDERDEPDESLYVNLTGATGAVIDDSRGLGIILDDDGEDLPEPPDAFKMDDSTDSGQSPMSGDDDPDLPRLSINDWKLKEKNGGGDGLPFTVSLSRPSAEEVTVSYATERGTAEDGSDKLTLVAEKATGEVTFQNVFNPDEKHQGVPRLPNGLNMQEPQFDEGGEYEVSPDNGQRPVPKFSRRRALAELATSGKSVEFNRNIVNRLWAMMMGRGLVHPVDLHHSENPPSHPELLDALAEHFVATGYDVKALLRELALSRTYQRSSLPLENDNSESEKKNNFAVSILRPLSAEQLAMSMLDATGATAVARREAEKQLSELAAATDAADTKPDKDPRQVLEQRIQELLKEDLERFVAIFSRSGVQDFQATVQQALYLSNNDQIERLLQPRAGSLIEQLTTMHDPVAIADHLYLSVLVRHATPEESTTVSRYLENRRNDRQSALRELVWALLMSNEFRFNF